MNTQLRKRLWYVCSHRGTKENDVLLSCLKDPILETLKDEDLKVMEGFLQLPDQDIYSYIMGEKKVPGEFDFIIILIRESRLV